uniref:Transposase-associated domain-containing protein n=1 Tax=Solanum tuberosum TaxID=4113 RepID=M1C783_SOLTU
MYNMHYETGAGLKPEFIDGVRNFIEHTMTLDIFKNNGLVRCPCSACGMEPEQYFDKAPNKKARRFYDQLEESSRPPCEGSPHSTLRNRPNHNDEGDIDPSFPPISNFNQNSRRSKKHGNRGFTDMEIQSAVTHILLNCPEIQLHVKWHPAKDAARALEDCTHVKKKENESDPDVLVEERAERTVNEFHQYVAENLDSLQGIGSSRQAEELDGVQIGAMSAQISQLTSALVESERRRVVEQQSMSAIVQRTKKLVLNLARRPTTSAPEDTDDDNEEEEEDFVNATP